MRQCLNPRQILRFQWPLIKPDMRISRIDVARNISYSDEVIISSLSAVQNLESFEGIAEVAAVLVKLTSKNQLTLPKAVTAAVESTDYFDIAVENGRIILTPVRVNRANGVRSKLAELGLTERDVSDAIAWVRTERQHQFE